MKFLSKLDIHWPTFIGFILYFGFIFFLYKQDELASIPTFTVAFIALIFSYFAYEFTRDKFRLELFDKRYGIYINILKFCSAVSTYGDLLKNGSETNGETQEKIDALIAPNDSFRGIGWHTSQMLFGPEIKVLMNEINKSYSMMVIKGYSTGHDEYAAWQKEKHAELVKLVKLVDELPKHFQAYLYFGDYKK